MFLENETNHITFLVRVRKRWRVPSNLMGLGGLGHKASSVEVDQEAGRRGEALGLQPQRQRDGSPLRAGQRQQSLAVLETVRQKGEERGMNDQKERRIHS